MSDDNDSGGIIGTIISILILAAIWPYLLAILGLYIAYIVVVAILEWMAQNPLIVASIILGALSAYAILCYRLIPKAWRWMKTRIQHKTDEGYLSRGELTSVMPDLIERKFIPSTNLYCYWCTKKLGIDSWERGGKYYCKSCYEKIVKLIRSINIKNIS